MQITYDPVKRAKTLEERGLDFEDAAEVFAGLEVTRLDEREDYGEDRYQTYGCSAIGWSWWCGPRAARIATLSR